MDDKPATSVSTSRPRIRSGPNQPVTAAKAGGYRMPDIAMPASAHASANVSRDVALATAIMAMTANTDPTVITFRGPNRSSHLPTGIPATAETRSPREKAALAALADQPVSAVMADSSTGKA